jgi:hypothetical protein
VEVAGDLISQQPVQKVKLLSLVVLTEEAEAMSGVLGQVVNLMRYGPNGEDVWGGMRKIFHKIWNARRGS